MRRIAAVILIICYALLGSGAVERWHNAQHAIEDAAGMVSGSSQAPQNSPLHTDWNCAFHAQLHLASMAVGWVPLLICLGLFLAFLTLLPVRLSPPRVVMALACRGPPVW